MMFKKLLLMICIAVPVCGVDAGVSLDIATLQQQAESGDAEAQNKLGEMYYGDGVEQSLSQAVQWFRKAAEQNNADAQCNLGVMYDNGDGVERSYYQAVHWYRRAVKQDHAKAQYNLGWMYYIGRGVDQSYGQAVHWYRKAAKQGYANGQYNLGFMYHYGHGVKQSYAQAMYWYRKAAEQGDDHAQYNLGVMYHYRHGVKQSDVQAMYWYRKAAEQNCDLAQNNLGELLEKNKHHIVTSCKTARDPEKSYAVLFYEINKLCSEYGFIEADIVGYVDSEQKTLLHHAVAAAVQSPEKNQFEKLAYTLLLVARAAQQRGKNSLADYFNKRASYKVKKFTEERGEWEEEVVYTPFTLASGNRDVLAMMLSSLKFGGEHENCAVQKRAHQLFCEEVEDSNGKDELVVTI